MYYSKIFKLTAALLIFVASFTACKKDPFTEQNAITAQGTLLQQMYSFQLQIAQVNAAASKSHDSALIAIQVLSNSGASALAVLQAQQNLAYLMQQYQNQIAIYKLQDSIAKGTAVTAYNNSITYQRFLDSLNAARTNANALTALTKNYTLKINDNITNVGIVGATVSVYSYVTNSIVTATSDANGVANFNQIIVDPGAYFYISKLGYAGTSIVRNNIGTGTTINLWNNGNAQNKVNGQIVADLDLTNGATLEGVAGQLITFSIINFNYNGVTQTIQFPVVTDANGNYSIKLPDAPSGYTYTVVTAPQITVSQKMFVRFMQGIDDQFKTLPHVDSVNATISLGLPNSSFNSAKLTWFPNYSIPNLANAFYLKLPNDSLGNQIFIPLSRSLSNFTNYWGTTSTNNPTFTNPSSNLVDSLYNIAFWYNNNGWQNGIIGGVNNNGFGSFSTLSVNDGNYNYSKKDTIVNATMVDLTGGNLMTATPTIKVHINANGKIANIVSSNGGLFKIYDWNNREITSNVFGYRDNNFKTNTFLNSTSVSIQGGITKIMNFDYANLISREKTPQ